MKKFLIVLIMVLFLTGCEIEKERPQEEKGKYREGTYFGYAYDKSYDAYATAVVYVNENGVIKSVFIDSTYINKTAPTTTTTKKIVGPGYGMKTTSSKMGKIEGGAEWYEQMGAVEKYVVEHQGLDINLDENGKTDAISGATLNLKPSYEAIINALNQAK